MIVRGFRRLVLRARGRMHQNVHIFPSRGAREAPVSHPAVMSQSYDVMSEAIFEMNAALLLGLMSKRWPQGLQVPLYSKKRAESSRFRCATPADGGSSALLAGWFRVVSSSGSSASSRYNKLHCCDSSFIAVPADDRLL